MKKVGIVTFHRANNYGSALQAYALNCYLRNIGVTAETVDIQPVAQKEMYKLFRPNNSAMNIARNTLTLRHLSKLLRRKRKFNRFLENRLILSGQSFTDQDDLSCLNHEYDLMLCGSDQIWNTACNDYSDLYLLSFISDKKKCISYAASTGNTKIVEAEVELFLKNLSQFRAVSMREKECAQKMEQLLGREVFECPDPTLLLSRDQWDEIAGRQKLKGYILCYFIGNVPGMRKYAEQLKKKTGLKLVIINFNIRDLFYSSIKKYDSGPEDFISLIRDAEYIVTDSFHATIFSLIYQKKFVVFKKKTTNNSNSRLESLLQMCGLADRVLEENEYKYDISTEIDYQSVEKNLKDFSNVGQSFLKRYILED